ncbi:uncharacterized protein LOC127805609 [Diospyros lotus]|uniref:uncharacterized protein LOC127805609 n=1 Tax=Diospyros lotus TaxID=55363 RepID=UPI002255C10A|nr:uncharacterized protein LOC127805609 [Diospyros lotus]
MKVLLGLLDIWEIVEDGYDKPQNETYEAALITRAKKELKEQRKKYKKSLYIIYQGVDEGMFELIPSATTSKEAWKLLQKAFDGVEKEDDNGGDGESATSQRGRGRNHGQGRGCGHQSNWSYDKSSIQGYNYNKFGHYASECYYKKNEKRVNYADNEEKQDDGVLLMAYSGVDTRTSSAWHLDTGASNHMCGRNEFFAELDEEFSGTITFGDLSQRLVKGKGKILLQLKTSG